MAAREQIILIHNSTSHNLTLVDASLEHGIWWSDPPPNIAGVPGTNGGLSWTNSPPSSIPPGASLGWGAQSSAFLTGTAGFVRYTFDNNGDEVQFIWNVPFAGIPAVASLVISFAGLSKSFASNHTFTSDCIDPSFFNFVALPAGGIFLPTASLGTCPIDTFMLVETGIGSSSSALTSLPAPNQITCGYEDATQITLDHPAKVEMQIALSSANPTLVIVPATVSIPVGALSAEVTIHTVARPIPFPPEFVKVQASYGGQTLTMFVEVVPPTVASISLSPAIVISGESVVGTVALNRPSLLGPVVVNLLCGSPGWATCPAKVTIPQNHTSAIFVISTPKHETTFNPVQIPIYASYAGTACSAKLTVKPSVIAGIVHSLTLFPSTVVGGHMSHGTVTLEQAVPTDTVVSLGAMGAPALSSPSFGESIASVPVAIVIPAGQTSASFPITTGKLVLAGTKRIATIMASAVGSKYAMLTVTS